MMMRLNRVIQPLTGVLAGRRFFQSPHEEISQEEFQHLQQEMPPRELLKELRTKDAAPSRGLGGANTGSEAEEDITVPGDSFGIMRNRVAFYKPLPRQQYVGELDRLFPVGSDPLHCVNPLTLRLLCSKYNVTLEQAATAMLDAALDINLAVEYLKQRFEVRTGHGSYGLVAMESYSPETFCLMSFNLPSLEATRDDAVLDAIHELVLSAAELPLDTPRKKLIPRFLDEWTIEDGQKCADVMKEMDISVQDIVLLPFGDYSAQGFYISHVASPDAPNIGTAAGCCCFDLRTGIHKRFRFHVERMADSVSEHVINEMLHYGQESHLLRQAYWFRPEYSVEEFLRFKESLLQPSASIFEMRYAALAAPQYGLNGYRNIVEMEKLKIAQHKYEKHYEDFTAPGKWVTSDNSQLQTVAAGGGGSNTPGAVMHQNTNSTDGMREAMETRAGPLRRSLETSIQAHGDRAFARFYRNNYH